MASKSKNSPSVKRKGTAWEQWPTYTTHLVLIGAGVTAAFALMGIFGSFADGYSKFNQSGPMPYPSREEVDKLRVDTKQGLSEVLELAKNAHVASQQALQTGDDNRLTRLLQQKVQLAALIAMNPSDTSLQLLQEQTIRQIEKLSAPAPTPSPALTGVPAIK